MKLVSLREVFTGLDREAKQRKYRELWHTARKFEILTDYPLHLDLELSGVCNLGCSDCFQSALDKKRLGLMSAEMFKAIIDDGVPRGLCSIKLQIRGESFLHPQLFELISHAKRAGVLDIQITTNGTLLNEETVDKILTSDLDGIIFSVDVRHEDACSKTNSHSDYSKVSNNVNLLLQERAKRRQQSPWIRLKASTGDTSPEVLKKLKADLVSQFPLADVHIVGSVFDFRKDRDSFPGLRERYVLNPCEYLMQRLAIYWDGQTTVCCMDYHGDFGLGSVPEKSIREIWLSDTMQGMRNAHLKGKRPQMPICRHCHACVSAACQEVYVDTTDRNLLDKRLQDGS
ncbi:radical SAM/SPASM domain-containing protein [Salidesulfovibrio onnuriiensis]|uniref:radical SAM/SPASM domain-containing protein n=1 Tax=Salidesulfovibrio onnuriiensis TaxID=2583823 RepID=UPI0011CA8B6B|nr:radical SAM/SPASM domain-containing protein [Salidesulfovibrio onnuriiensis]